jgi:hypothetical protein
MYNAYSKASIHIVMVVIKFSFFANIELEGYRFYIIFAVLPQKHTNTLLYILYHIKTILKIQEALHFSAKSTNLTNHTAYKSSAIPRIFI